MGIRKKIMLGFAILGFLLFFSALISYFELNKLSTTTKGMHGRTMRTMVLSKEMLDAAQDQNTALLQMLMSGDSSADSLLRANRVAFNTALEESISLVDDPSRFDVVKNANQQYNVVVDERLQRAMTDSENLNWFLENYKNSYYTLTSVVKDLMVSTQQRMDARAVQLEGNAYRAIMPGVIALGIAIAIIAMFFYFMDIYYIRPVLRINETLKNFLKAKVPFKVTLEGKDEVNELKENIEQLTDQLKPQS